MARIIGSQPHRRDQRNKSKSIHTIRILETVAARAAVRKTERADNMATLVAFVKKSGEGRKRKLGKFAEYIFESVR